MPKFKFIAKVTIEHCDSNVNNKVFKLEKIYSSDDTKLHDSLGSSTNFGLSIAPSIIVTGENYDSIDNHNEITTEKVRANLLFLMTVEIREYVQGELITIKEYTKPFWQTYCTDENKNIIDRSFTGYCLGRGDTVKSIKCRDTKLYGYGNLKNANCFDTEISHARSEL